MPKYVTFVREENGSLNFTGLSEERNHTSTSHSIQEVLANLEQDLITDKSKRHDVLALARLLYNARDNYAALEAYRIFTDSFGIGKFCDLPGDVRNNPDFITAHLRQIEMLEGLGMIELAYRRYQTLADAKAEIADLPVLINKCRASLLKQSTAVYAYLEGLLLQALGAVTLAQDQDTTNIEKIRLIRFAENLLYGMNDEQQEHRRGANICAMYKMYCRMIECTLEITDDPILATLKHRVTKLDASVSDLLAQQQLTPRFATIEYLVEFSNPSWVLAGRNSEIKLWIPADTKAPGHNVEVTASRAGLRA